MRTTLGFLAFALAVTYQLAVTAPSGRLSIEYEYAQLRDVEPGAPPLVIFRRACGEPSAYYTNGLIYIDEHVYTQVSRDTTRWVLAHELGHYLHQRFAPDDYWHMATTTPAAINNTLDDPEQQWANRVADQLVPYWEEIALDEIYRAKQFDDALSRCVQIESETEPKHGR